jgi:hypothetical protein
LLEHLLASLQTISGEQKTLQLEIQNWVLHPSHKVLAFKYNLSNNG